MSRFNKVPNFTKVLAKHADTLRTGRVLAVDPASGASSQPGYAIYINSELVEYGVVDLGKGAAKLPVQRRLAMISDAFSDDELYPEGWDILLIERIRGRMAHEYLKWSVGVIIAAVDATTVIEVPVSVWKSYAKRRELEHGTEHTKGDAEDAKIIGESVLSLLR